MLPNLTNATADDIRPMTKEESACFLLVSMWGMMDDKRYDQPGPLTEELFTTNASPTPFTLRVMLGRLIPTGLDYSPAAVAACAMMSRSPGDAVMYAYTLYQASREGTPWTLENLTGPDGPFANGFPTEQYLERAWNDQKQPGAPLGNAVDDMTNWNVKVDA